MGVLKIIGKILTLKPVEAVISKLLGKIFRQGDGGSKPSIGLSVAAVLAGLITLVQMVDPGLAEILNGHEVTLIGFVAFVQTIFMYYRKEDVIE